MRRALDAYYTPSNVTELLIEKIPALKTMVVCEPCAGRGAISKCFEDVYAYDIDPTMGLPVADACTHRYPANVGAFITNPPFNVAFDILRNLREQQGEQKHVILLLRLSFLEPTYERGPWLAENPPQYMFVCPRISFTGDGKTDSTTVAWMCWLAGEGQGAIHVFPKAARK